MQWQAKLDRGDLLILDGGTGSELQRRGVPMTLANWSGVAVHTHPEVVREVHAAYIEAGADVITTNTFGTSRFLLEPAGLENEFEAINRRAVAAAREAIDASERDVVLAGSISNLPPNMNPRDYPAPERELAELSEQASLLADCGVDLIALEMMQDTRHAKRAMQAALGTGLPVWLGVSCRLHSDGADLVSFDLPNVDFRAPLDTLIAMGPSVVNVMHSPVDAVLQAIDMVRERWGGPLGVYPELGDFQAPQWQFDMAVPPSTLVEHARRWVDRGVSLVGGCCGTTPEHIAALKKAFG